MSASLYGWSLSGLADTNALNEHVTYMLTKTQEHVTNLNQKELRAYITKRIECLCELAYVFLLSRHTKTDSADDTIVLTFVEQLAHHVAEMCNQKDRPHFTPENMPADNRAHCLATALQLLITTPPRIGIIDPRKQKTHPPQKETETDKADARVTSPVPTPTLITPKIPPPDGALPDPGKSQTPKGSALAHLPITSKDVNGAMKAAPNPPGATATTNPTMPLPYT
jgi:hypothetical protein